MKYDIAVTVSVLVAAILIGAGYFDSERAARHAMSVRVTVSSLSVQQLASEIPGCDKFPVVVTQSRDRRMVYCAEVIRAMDAQPLQAVVIRHDIPDMIFPEAIPSAQPTIQKFTVPPEELKVPILEQPQTIIFDAPRVS